MMARLASTARSSLSGMSGIVWWLITPRKRNPGSDAISLARATPWSISRTPQRRRPVSSSMTTPISTPRAVAALEISLALTACSQATSNSAWSAREQSRSIFIGSTISDVMNTLAIPPWTMTSASDTLAAQTPPTVPPRRICRWAIAGVLWFLAWPRSLAVVPAYVLAMTSILLSRSSMSMIRQGVSKSSMGVPGVGR